MAPLSFAELETEIIGDGTQTSYLLIDVLYADIVLDSFVFYRNRSGQ